jgi:hypothetical protein
VRSTLHPRILAGMLGLLATALLTGCGLGAGRTPGGVQLLITRDFGTRVVLSPRAPSVHGAETAMSLLMRNAKVQTRYAGGFVQSIDGLAGGHERSAPVDWFYYVNGIEAPSGAAATKLHGGDRIWWDRHNWSQTDNIPAVVGSFPEPFLHGIDGKRLPVRVQCSALTGVACRAVLSQLRAARVPAAAAALDGANGPHTLAVLVAPWRLISRYGLVRSIAQGPAASGVYATFSDDGATLAVLDQDGRRVRTLQAGAGLIAATRQGEDPPTWVVTGTDEVGTARAAAAFNAGQLGRHFAIALAAIGTQSLSMPLPLQTP